VKDTRKTAGGSRGSFNRRGRSKGFAPTHTGDHVIEKIPYANVYLVACLIVRHRRRFSACPQGERSAVLAGRSQVAFAVGPRLGPSVATLLLLAPVFLVFEIWQLVLSERYLGIKQIARGTDPRTLGLSEARAFFWTLAILTYWMWMVLLLVTPGGRLPGIGLLAVTALGFSIRRGAALKWILVILTFEGAVRIGVLISVIALLWQRR
jgi:hypothetical protein